MASSRGLRGTVVPRTNGDGPTASGSMISAKGAGHVPDESQRRMR